MDRSVSLAAEYSTPYNAIVRDDVVMGITRYFLERWVPVLGTGPAAVVNTLRQLDYRCQNDDIEITGEALAREAGLSRRYLYTCLETPWMAAFVRLDSGERLRDHTGKVSQLPNRYHVRMDDPLTAADADQLRRVLINLADTPLEAAKRALEIPPEKLWAEILAAPSDQFTEPRPITARDVLLRAFPTWKPSTTEEEQAAEALHRHVTLVRSDGRASKIIVPQYFRRRWWKRLGHDLAWTYLFLRSRVYDSDDGTRRDVCWIPCLNVLLDIIGRPREWWRRNVENASQKDTPLQAFFRQIDSQKGRDSANPQWVARQFWVALDIPIAPEDKATYEQLLKNWPSSPQSPQPPAGVRHIETHRADQGLPHLNTPDNGGSATSVHTGEEGVRHIGAQGSATSVHRESESLKLASPPKTEASSTTSISEPPTVENSGRAAADDDSAKSFLERKNIPLIEILEETLAAQPLTPIFRAAPVETWLEQTWPEPVRRHTPAWTLVQKGQVSPRDLVALILSVCVERAIKQPPRYLSWLVQRWQTMPEVAPVENWDKWRALADLPIGQWFEQGRELWIELAPQDHRALPFGLDALEVFDDDEEPESPPVPAVPPPDGPNGLDDRLAESSLSMREIWQATLGQLSLQLTPTTYHNWLDGAQAVAYADGVLTVRARVPLARDMLEKRLNATVEQAASTIARQPIKIQYLS